MTRSTAEIQVHQCDIAASEFLEDEMPLCKIGQ